MKFIKLKTKINTIKQMRIRSAQNNTFLFYQTIIFLNMWKQNRSL